MKNARPFGTSIADRQAGKLFHGASFAIILLIIVKFLLQSWSEILISDYPDTDDALRLAQVRDWMAGQNWFDTTQYRINPPTGGDIHWSRLIDLPMAALLWLLTPVFGPAMAERIMLASYPMLLLAGLIWLMASTVRRHFGMGVAIVAAFMLPLSMGIAIQFMPMRIDHHGVQILLAAVAFALALRPSQDGAILRRTAMTSGGRSVAAPPFTMLPIGKVGDSCENFCQARNVSLAGPWPVGRPVLPIATLA